MESFVRYACLLSQLLAFKIFPAKFLFSTFPKADTSSIDWGNKQVGLFALFCRFMLAAPSG